MDDPALQMEVKFVSFERREKPEFLKNKLKIQGGESTTLEFDYKKSRSRGDLKNILRERENQNS